MFASLIFFAKKPKAIFWLVDNCITQRIALIETTLTQQNSGRLVASF